MTVYADLVFTGGPVHLGDPARSRATAVAVFGERIVAVGHDEVPSCRPRHRGGRPRRSAADPRLPGRARPPGRRRGRAGRLRPQRGGHHRGVPATGSRRTPTRTRSAAWITGGGWSMEAFPGGTPDRGAAGRARARPAGVPAQPRPPRRLGQHPRPGAGRHRRPDPRPRRRADRARRRRRPRPACCRRARCSWSAAHVPGRHGRASRLAGLLRAQALLHSLGITAWQDALVGADVGMADPSRRPTCGRPATDRSPPGSVGALWWDRGAGPEQIPELRRTAGPS